MPSPTSQLSQLPFAQSSKLTDLLRQLVRSYPAGIGIIHELIQNADDAGASTISIVLDERQHPTNQLPSKEMQRLQGPALVVVNDASFSDEDWKRIQSTGRSGKILDTSKTGRFGLGFNSVYNVTDWPGVLTGDRIGVFDPHGGTVNGATRDQPGAAWELTDELWEGYADFLAPFQNFGLEIGAKRIANTVFRFPLRDLKAAKNSDICDQPFTANDFSSLLKKLIDEAGELLLFLKNLHSIHVERIGTDTVRENLVTIKTVNVKEVAEGRDRVHSRLDPGYKGMHDLLRETNAEDLVSEYLHHTVVERPGVDSIEQRWLLVQALVAGPDNKLLSASQRMFDYEEKAVPLVGAAVQIQLNDNLSSPDGRLFCTLPLSSVSSFLPIHINGFFDLQSDRQGIFADEGAEGKAAARVEWNRSLLKYGCSEVAAKLLAALTKKTFEPTDAYKLWPLLPKSKQTMLQGLPEYVYSRLLEYECIPCGIDHRLAAPNKVSLLTDVDVRLVLLADDLPLANPVPPTHVVEGFEGVKAPLSEMLPHDVRDNLRVTVDPACVLHDSPRKALSSEANVKSLLRYCCSDSVLDQLKGVPLALTSDNVLHAFGLCDEPLLIVSEEERILLQALPALLLHKSITSVPRLEEEKTIDLLRVTPDLLVSFLPRFLRSLDDTGRVKWDRSAEDLPNKSWLIAFYSYLQVNVEECNLEAPTLKCIPLVPDQFGFISATGHDRTPLLPSVRETKKGLVQALQPFQVPLVDAEEDLLTAIRCFVDAAEDAAIWLITGRDLVDTLAAVQDDWDNSVAKYSADVHGVLLSYLATDQAITGVGERAEKLRALPVFPDTNGKLNTLESDKVFLSAGYDLPSLETGLGFLDVGPNGEWYPLYETLNVQTLSKARFVQQVLITSYAQLASDDQIELLQWLRTNLEAAFNELSDTEEQTLLELLQRSELVLCTNGRCHPGRSIYHPDIEQTIGSLLGTGVGFPDMSVYEKKEKSWLRLFEKLGMASQPRAIDLLSTIDEARDNHRTDPSSATATLTKITEYVESNWSDLRDKKVDDDPMRPVDAENWTLLEGLKIRPWLIVQNSCPTGYPSSLFTQRPPILSRPSDLFSREVLDLVSLVAPVSSLKLPVLGKDIGVHETVDKRLTLEQLRSVLELISGEIEGDDSSKINRQTAAVLRSLYSNLGDLFPAHEDHDGEMGNAIAEIQKEFTFCQCLIDKEGSLWRPDRVFTKPVPYFLGKRTNIQSRSLSTERGLEILGRKAAPEVDDFVEFFKEIDIEYSGRSVEEEELSTLREAFYQATLVEDPSKMLHFAHVLTNSGHLELANEVLIDDAEWWSDRAQQAGLTILDPELNMEVAHKFGIRALSKAVLERPSRTSANQDSSFEILCKSIDQVVRSVEMARGVQRLTKAAGTSISTSDLKWLSNISIEPVNELHSELVWVDRGESIENSEGSGDVLLDPGGRKILASIEAKNVLHERLAKVLAHELDADGNSLNDLSPLVAMLRSDPDEIETLLTQLRIPKLLEVSENFEFDEDGGYIDEEDSTENELKEAEEVESNTSHGSDVGNEGETIAVKSSTGDLGQSNIGNSDAGSLATTHHEKKPESSASGSADSARTEAAPLGDIPNPADSNRSPIPRPGATTGSSDSRSDFSVSAKRAVSSKPNRRSDNNRRAVTYVKPDGENVREQNDVMTEHRTRVDRSAVEIVLRYERDNNRLPEEQEHSNPGFDIFSADNEGEIQRYIEVKGLSGSWSDFGVGVKPRQIDKCREEQDRFWLYVVEFALEPERAEVFAIQNPVSSIDEYRFDGGWKGYSEDMVNSGQQEHPEVGTRVRLSDASEGIVDAIDSRGAVMRLRILLDSGETKKLVYSTHSITLLSEIGQDRWRR